MRQEGVLQITGVYRRKKGQKITSIFHLSLIQWIKSVSRYLLGLVKAVNFIDEQDGLPLAQSELILCLFYHLPDIIDGRTRGRHGDKTSCALPFAFAGDYVS